MVDIKHKQTICLFMVHNSTHPDWLFIHLLFQHHVASDLSQGTVIALTVCVSMWMCSLTVWPQALTCVHLCVVVTYMSNISQGRPAELTGKIMKR